jgi:hypothetical protein
VATSEESEVESEVEVIYPGKFQLGLLTIGLCLSTFAIALGRLWMSHLSYAVEEIFCLSSTSPLLGSQVTYISRA